MNRVQAYFHLLGTRQVFWHLMAAHRGKDRLTHAAHRHVAAPRCSCCRRRRRGSAGQAGEAGVEDVDQVGDLRRVALHGLGAGVLRRRPRLEDSHLGRRHVLVVPVHRASPLEHATGARLVADVIPPALPRVTHGRSGGGGVGRGVMVLLFQVSDRVAFVVLTLQPLLAGRRRDGVPGVGWGGRGWRVLFVVALRHLHRADICHHRCATGG